MVKLQLIRVIMESKGDEDEDHQENHGEDSHHHHHLKQEDFSIMP
jgi:hypothetical protein